MKIKRVVALTVVWGFRLTALLLSLLLVLIVVVEVRGSAMAATAVFVLKLVGGAATILGLGWLIVWGESYLERGRRR